MIRLVPNANRIAERVLKMDNVVSIKSSLKYYIKNNLKTKFAADLQIYVTKLGLALEQCVCSNCKMYAHTYLGSIDFICKKLLNNIPLYNIMKGIQINDSGNTVKHQIKNINIDIDFTLKNYNLLISEIVKATGLSAFKECYLNKTPNVRDIPVVETTRHHKYFMVGDRKFQLKLNERYEVDPYTKGLSTKITLYWPEAMNDEEYASITVKSTKTGKVLCSNSHVDISRNNDKIAFPIQCTGDDLDRRVLSLDVTIEIKQDKREFRYTEGALWWKRDVYEDVTKTICTHKEQVTQLFRPRA